MIETLTPYPAYKDSGLPWLGQVPEHWETAPLARLARLKTVVNQVNRQLLSVYLHRGVVRFTDIEEKRTNATSIDLSKYQVVDPGDFVLNNQQAWRGSVGVSKYAGIVSPAYIVLTLSEKFMPQYANLFFRDGNMVSQYLACSKGVGTIQRNLYWPHLKRVGVIIPPPAEQAAIVRFLEWAGGRLERAIRAKRKIIALLNEQKQAIIHRAVTRGLDPNVPLKDSGIPWLGEIPAHWEMRSLKRIVETKITDGPHETPELLDHGIDFMSAESMVDGQLLFERRRGFISRKLHEQYCIKCRPQRDDIFMCKSGATTGKVAIVETDREFSVWSPLALLRANKTIMLPRFLFMSLQTKYVQQQVQERWSFGTQPNLSMAAMGRIAIAVPTVTEQADALLKIEQELNPLLTTISRLEREIALLREYRTRLVADVVTGKLDVRAAAASLPDEVATDDSTGADAAFDDDDAAVEEDV